MTRGDISDASLEVAGERVKTGRRSFWTRSWWVWCLVFLPGLWPIWRYAQSDPRVLADPVEYALNYTGFVAVLWLVAVLSLTPLRRLLPCQLTRDLNRHRRLVGVTAWGWGTLHVGFYLLYAGGWEGLRENFAKPFIIAGLVGWLILGLLAVTSLRSWGRRLGGRRWKRLHRLVYVAAVVLLYHYGAQEKAGPALVYWIAGPLLLLELVRIGKWWTERSRTP